MENREEQYLRSSTLFYWWSFWRAQPWLLKSINHAPAQALQERRRCCPCPPHSCSLCKFGNIRNMVKNLQVDVFNFNGIICRRYSLLSSYAFWLHGLRCLPRGVTSVERAALWRRCPVLSLPKGAVHTSHGRASLRSVVQVHLVLKRQLKFNYIWFRSLTFLND